MLTLSVLVSQEEKKKVNFILFFKKIKLNKVVVHIIYTFSTAVDC